MVSRNASMTAPSSDQPMTPLKASRPNWFWRWRVLTLPAALVVCMAVYSGIAEVRDNHAFMINTSDSLPNWAFFVHKNKNPVRGDLVFFRPPHSPLLTRHFGESVKPFGKYVYGMPGDVVSHDGNRVLVNGRVVASMKPTTRTGETLHHGPIGRIPARCYYVGTPHPDGFDSRYAEIGFVCRDRILGTGVSIL